MNVTRWRQYQRTGRYAWYWRYTVHLPDGTTAEAGTKSEVKGVIDSYNRKHGTTYKPIYT